MLRCMFVCKHRLGEGWVGAAVSGSCIFHTQGADSQEGVEGSAVGSM